MTTDVVQITGDFTQDNQPRVTGFTYRQVLFIAFILVSIALCEWVFAYQNVAYGIIIALALVIAIYITVSVLKLDWRIVNSAESLTLLPLFILFTSSFPWFFISQQYLLPAAYSCMLGLCLWHIYRRNLSLRELFGFNIKKLLKYSLIGLAIGIPLGVGEYLVLTPAPAFPSFEVKYFLRDLAYMILFVGMAEEILFRGLIQRDLTKVLGWKWALCITAALFAVMHLTWRSIPELGFVFVGGLILGALYLRTKSLIAPIVAHGINNVILVAIAPYIFMG